MVQTQNLEMEEVIIERKDCGTMMMTNIYWPLKRTRHHTKTFTGIILLEQYNYSGSYENISTLQLHKEIET